MAHAVVSTIAIYAALAAALDWPAHRLVYPLVGDGYPLTGRRRWLVRVFGPFIIAGIWLGRLPVIIALILIGAGRAR